MVRLASSPAEPISSNGPSGRTQKAGRGFLSNQQDQGLAQGKGDAPGILYGVPFLSS